MKIEAKKLKLAVGDTPEITITITNNTKETITLVQPGDGSSCGWRTPLVGWSAGEGPRPEKAPEREKVMRCGNINTLKAAEVLEIAPGKSIQLGSWAGSPTLRAGKCTVAFYYSNDPGLQWKGVPLGRHDEEAMKKVKASHKCSLKSNDIEFTIE